MTIIDKTAVIAFDTETHATISHHCVCPPLVSLCSHQRTADGDDTQLVVKEDATELFISMLDSGKYLVGHNTPFDLAVLVESAPPDDQEYLLRRVFDSIATGQIRCTKIREQLKNIATGEFRIRKYHLATLVERYTGQKLAKGDDTFRLRYAELTGVPISDWPEAAVRYAKLDAIMTLVVYFSQIPEGESVWAVPNALSRDEEAHQMKAAWALHLMSSWGVRSDAKRVTKLRQTLETQMALDRDRFLAEGLLTEKWKGRKPNKVVVGYKAVLKEVRRLVQEAFELRGETVPTTEPSTRYPEGSVCVDRDTLLDTGSPLLRDYAERARIQKTLGFVPVLEKAKSHPFCPRWKVLVSSGRTACGEKEEPGNLQQPPVKGGVRECIVPRRGFVFCAVDYATAELRALAQICYEWFGASVMREALISGQDLHSVLGAQILGVSLGTFSAQLDRGLSSARDARQQAKAANFGYPVGMAASTFARDSRRKGHEIGVRKAQELKDRWLAAWPEMHLYFERVAEICGPLGNGTLTQVRSGRVRGNITFTSGGNSFFQGLSADFAKDALCRVTDECWVSRRGKESPLLGCRPVLFLHDEIIVEVLEDVASDAAHRISELMVAAASDWCPDVPHAAEPTLMRRWDKRAEPVFDAAGKLLVWEGEG